MSDTFEAKLVYHPFAGGNPKTEMGKISDSGIYPGYAIRVVDSLIYLAKASDLVCSGVMTLKRGMAVDAAYTANDFAHYFPRGFGAIVWIYIASASPVVAIDPGETIVLSATDGMGMKFVWADSSASTDNLAHKIGVSVGDIAGHVTGNLLLKVVLN